MALFIKARDNAFLKFLQKKLKFFTHTDTWISSTYLGHRIIHVLFYDYLEAFSYPSLLTISSSSPPPPHRSNHTFRLHPDTAKLLASPLKNDLDRVACSTASIANEGWEGVGVFEWNFSACWEEGVERIPMLYLSQLL